MTHLRELERSGWLSMLDVELAETIARVGGEKNPDVRLALAWTSRQVRRGHVCLDLPRLAAGTLSIEAPEGAAAPAFPEDAAWRRTLRRSAIVRDEGSAARAPLVLDERGRLYFERYFDHQQALAAHIRGRLDRPRHAVPDGLVDRILEDTADDAQRLAVTRALERDFVVVTGGPGTGKTTTVARILAALAESALGAGQRPPDALLLAPTGKAAARLEESIDRARATLRCSDGAREAIPRRAKTIHRALGIGERGATRPRHDADDPVRADVVVVDEASMVDLPLMRRLFDAIAPATRVVLLGDENQLSSVEVGTVLADLCQSDGVRDEPLGGAVVRLERTHRYAAESGIAVLAEAIRRGDPGAAIDALEATRFDDVRRIDVSADARALASLRKLAEEGFGPLFEDTSSPLGTLDRFRILLPHRRGSLGVEALNRSIEGWLADARGVTTDALPIRPIMVTRNDYALELFNGDVGASVIGRDGQRTAFFGREGSSRRFPVERLPPHETVFAMSVHKSQGSEVDDVLFVLPAESSRIVTRELLYTAVTRARRSVTILGSTSAIERAIERRVERASGLRDALSPPSAAEDRQQKLPF